MLFSLDRSLIAQKERILFAHLLLEQWFIDRTFFIFADIMTPTICSYIKKHKPEELTKMRIHSKYYYNKETNEISAIETKPEEEIIFEFVANKNIIANVYIKPLLNSITIYTNLYYFKIDDNDDFVDSYAGIITEELKHLKDSLIHRKESPNKDFFFDKAGYALMEEIAKKFNLTNNIHYIGHKNIIHSVLYIMSDTEFEGHLANYTKILNRIGSSKIEKIISECPKEALDWNKAILVSSALTKEYPYFGFAELKTLRKEMKEIINDKTEYISALFVIIASYFAYFDYVKDTNVSQKVIDDFKTFKYINTNIVTKDMLDYIKDCIFVYMSRVRDFTYQLSVVTDDYLKGQKDFLTVDSKMDVSVELKESKQKFKRSIYNFMTFRDNGLLYERSIDYIRDDDSFPLFSDFDDNYKKNMWIMMHNMTLQEDTAFIFDYSSKELFGL